MQLASDPHAISNIFQPVLYPKLQSENDDDLREDPMAARLGGEEINAITYEEGSQKDEEDNDVDDLISM